VIGKKVLAEAAGLATTAIGEEFLHQQRTRHAAELSRLQSGQRFGSPTAVQSVHGPRANHSSSGPPLRLVPNVYGGWNYYASDGRPVAFSVPEVIYVPGAPGPRWTGGFWYFDPSGYPIH
jgi:hypothetical protein